MPETFNGIPIHPLVVHAVVVLIPLAAVGVIAIAVYPKWRASFGFFVLLVALVGTALVPIATMSGNNLAVALGEPPLVLRHKSLGQTLIYLAVPLLVMAIILWWMGRRERHHRTNSSALSLIVGVLAVVVAAATIGQVVRIGHSGADAVWSGVLNSEGQQQGSLGSTR
ncbi:MAG TPA: DUF2231 domain-containing protein [Actinomycetes bacterium]|nr:DUF2231 domain-containing protein [Actinomycetes bacterium]